MRDAEHPCFNPELLKAVSPRPIAALLETEAPCDPFHRAWPISVCWFGVSASQGPATVALIGDSHATHWRPAVSVLARAEGWHGASIARTSCPFMLGTLTTLGPRQQQPPVTGRAVLHPQVGRRHERLPVDGRCSAEIWYTK